MNIPIHGVLIEVFDSITTFCGHSFSIQQNSRKPESEKVFVGEYKLVTCKICRNTKSYKQKVAMLAKKRLMESIFPNRKFEGMSE